MSSYPTFFTVFLSVLVVFFSACKSSNPVSGNTAPVITAQPVTTATYTGQSATFAVLATGGELSYQWHKNGTLIGGATNSIYQTPPVTTNDNGALFKCEVKNNIGSVISNEAALVIITADMQIESPEIISNPQSISVQSGRQASFSVYASGEYLSYQWQKNGVPVPGEIFDTYTIASVAISDNNARISCIVINPVGTVTSSAATLTVTQSTTPGTSGDLTGNWVLIKEIEIERENGTIVDADTMDYTISESYMAANFSSGKMTLHYHFMGNAGSDVLDYSVSGSNITVDGETAQFSISGNILVLRFVDDQYEDIIHLQRYSGNLPPAEWNITDPDTPTDAVVIQTNGTPISANLSRNGADWYSFSAQEGVIYTIESTGDLDTYLKLFIEYESALTMIDEDDDSGEDFNAKIVFLCPLSSTYYFLLTGFDSDETGPYQVSVTRRSGALTKTIAETDGSKLTAINRSTEKFRRFYFTKRKLK